MTTMMTLFFTSGKFSNFVKIYVALQLQSFAHYPLPIRYQSVFRSQYRKKPSPGCISAHMMNDLPEADQKIARYQVQSQRYLNQAFSGNLSLLYVASELGHEIPKFINDASHQNITVTAKLDLLKGKDRDDLLHDFTSDQQALVDYLVLSKASEFAGVGHSSFAWNVALARHLYTTQKGNELDGPQIFGDDLSLIYGTPGGHPKFPASMWP